MYILSKGLKFPLFVSMLEFICQAVIINFHHLNNLIVNEMHKSILSRIYRGVVS